MAIVPTEHPSVPARLIEEVCNREDHASLIELVPIAFRVLDPGVWPIGDGPSTFLDILNTYKAFSPDLRFTVRAAFETSEVSRVDWSACGHHYGCAGALSPTRKAVATQGHFTSFIGERGAVSLMADFGIATFVQSLGIKLDIFNAALGRPTDEPRVRAESRADGTPVLYIPTMNLPGWITWRRCADVLKMERPVISVQLLSSCLAFRHAPVPTGYDLQTEVQGLRKALARSALHGPFHVVGDSAGGAIALDFAMSDTRAAASLTLIEPSAFWILDKTDVRYAEIEEYQRRQLDRFAGPITERTLIEDLLLAGVYRDEATIRSSDRWRLMCAYRHYLPFRRMLYHHTDAVERLQQLSCSVFLVEGTESAYVFHAIVRELKNRISRVEHVRLSGGHSPHRNDMTGFANTLKSFIERSELPPLSLTDGRQRSVPSICCADAAARQSKQRDP